MNARPTAGQRYNIAVPLRDRTLSFSAVLGCRSYASLYVMHSLLLSRVNRTRRIPVALSNAPEDNSGASPGAG